MGRSFKTNNFDAVEKAQAALDYIISGREEVQLQQRAARMPVSQALDGEQVLSFASERAHSRVLFISSDASGLDEDSWLNLHAKEISSVFAEVHVVVLNEGGKLEFPTKRIGDNIWFYCINFSSTWFFSQTLDTFAEAQLSFGDGFRPDVIVALDPFLAGKAALHLGRSYGRPAQVHVLKNYFDSGFLLKHKDNKKKVRIARGVLKRAKSVRTNSSIVKGHLADMFPRIDDLDVLPRQVGSDELLKAKRSNAIKRRYPQYVFIMLAVGALDHDNTIFRTLDAARSLLFSPRIGLVVLGDGPMRGDLEKRTEILEIKEQVVFEKNITLLHDYLLSADMFVCTDTTQSGDEYVVKAAAAGLPIVMARTPLRQDLFVDGESGFFCDAENTIDFNQKMNAILNNNAFRQQFGANARRVVKDRLQTDPKLYRSAYRDSIEVVFGNAGPMSIKDQANQTESEPQVGTAPAAT